GESRGCRVSADFSFYFESQFSQSFFGFPPRKETLVVLGIANDFQQLWHILAVSVNKKSKALIIHGLLAQLLFRFFSQLHCLQAVCHVFNQFKNHCFKFFAELTKASLSHPKRSHSHPKRPNKQKTSVKYCQSRTEQEKKHNHRFQKTLHRGRQGNKNCDGSNDN